MFPVSTRGRTSLLALYRSGAAIHMLEMFKRILQNGNKNVGLTSITINNDEGMTESSGGEQVRAKERTA